MMRGPDTATLLARALAASATLHGLNVAVEERGARRWHSATFSGHKHALTLTALAGGTDAKAWLAGLCKMDVRLPGELLAGISIIEEGECAGGCRAEVEALTVELA